MQAVEGTRGVSNWFLKLRPALWRSLRRTARNPVQYLEVTQEHSGAQRSHFGDKYKPSWYVCFYHWDLFYLPQKGSHQENKRRYRPVGPGPAHLILEFSTRRTAGNLNSVSWTEKLRAREDKNVGFFKGQACWILGKERTPHSAVSLCWSARLGCSDRKAPGHPAGLREGLRGLRARLRRPPMRPDCGVAP